MIGTYQPGIIDRALAVFGYAKARPPAPAQLYPLSSSAPTFAPINFPGWAEWEAQYANNGSQDEARAKTAASSSWVYACVSAIANEASVARLVVKERVNDAGEEDVENHPLERLWEAPNPFMGRSYLVSFWLWQRLLFGTSYLYWVPNSAGEIVECWPVPSMMVKPIPDPKTFISGYLFKSSPSAKPIRIDAKYITYSRIPHPFDIRDGLSPLAAAFVDIEAELAMAKWNRAFFGKENATPEGLISVNKDMLDTDIARVRQEITDFFGNGNRRVAVARAGDMDWKAFGRSQKDMEFLQGRVASGSAIMRVFGIPEGYFAKDATRANSEGAKATMIEAAVWPHLVALAEDLNAQMLPAHYADPDLHVAFDDIRPRNRALELQEFTAYQAVLTVNELRKLISVDDLPEDDKRGSLLVKEIEMGAAAPEAPAAEELPPAELPEGDEAGDVPEEIAEAKAADVITPADWLREAAESLRTDDYKALGGLVDMLRVEDVTPALSDPAVDIDRWRRKALAAVKSGKRAAVPFESTVIPPDTAQAIRDALEGAQDVAAVKAAFAQDDADARAAKLVDGVFTEALAWAKAAMEGGE